jgi:CubicO group peptidase (beta-lactamase class C family)
VWATARDWARFGQLYLDDGVVGDHRLLPIGWAEQAATPTPLASGGYGSLFWTNGGDSPGTRARRERGMTPDRYEARGYLGQWVVVVPSARLVIARFGNSRGGDQGVPRLVADVIAAFATP